jgi:hypothetical protein
MPTSGDQDDTGAAAAHALTRLQVRELSVATLGIDERTIRRAYANPATVRESTLVRIERGARELGLESPRVSRETRFAHAPQRPGDP